MRKTTDRKLVHFALIVYLLFCVGGAVTHRVIVRREARRYAGSMGVFWEAWDALEEDFYGSLPSPRERTYGAIRGALETLGDPYTIFLPPQTSEVEQDRLAGAYGGIGVDLWWNDNRPTLSPFPDSPAQEAGLQSGDLLLAVDGEPVAGYDLDEIRVLLRGEVSSTVALTIYRPPTLTLTVTRAEIQIPSVTYRLLDLDQTVGYIHITTFNDRTPDETERAAESLLNAGASRLVLDLRDNGGGLVNSAVMVADLFLSDGVAMYTAWRESESSVEMEPGGLLEGMPTVVLVNHSTASAAEILAGALQIREHTPLIGEQTRGKGSVQGLFSLSDGSSLHVTTSIWLLPNHQPLPESGLTPDIPISPDADAPGDELLERAVQYLDSGE